MTAMAEHPVAAVDEQPSYARVVTEGLRQRYEAGESAVRIAREVGKPVAYLRFLFAAAGVRLRPQDEARRDRSREREWEANVRWIDDLARRGIAHLPRVPLRRYRPSGLNLDPEVVRYIIEECR